MSADLVGCQRSVSPTTAIWRDRRACREHMATMVNMGLHVFNPEWQARKGGLGRMFSPSFRQVTMKIHGTGEQLTFPVQTCTRVGDVRAALSQCLMVNKLAVEFFVKQGCSTRRQKPCEEIGSNVTVKGVTSFKPAPHKWQHPTAIIGCGYGGMKCLMTYIKDGDTNIVAVERLSRVGGFNWITAANKSSKLQTEFGSFHVWWGQEFIKDTVTYPDSKVWGIWPSKAKVLEHFQFAAEEYGILPYMHFNTSAESIDIIGPTTSPLREYQLKTESTETHEEDSLLCSVIWGFPGNTTRNRIVDYPGEDVFEGHIAYGMNDDCPYDHIKGKICAVLGNGAFAVENCRTCMDYGADRVFMVTRRKNLVCPRVPCWFANQAIAPTPGWLILKMFEPFYRVARMGDPWLYHSVRANADRTHANISQSSRFGIGDITFLMCASGILEYVVDTVKRLSEQTMHLTSGRKLSSVAVILKALGLLGDHKFDALHKMATVVGQFCDGDWRRPFQSDVTGMHAANFASFAEAGMAYKGFSKTYKHLMDYPAIVYKAIDNGLMGALPKNTPAIDEDRPAYAVSIHHGMSAGMIVGSMCPEIVALNAHDDEYMHRMYHCAHGTREFINHCIAEWDHYQALWKKEGRGVLQAHIPYPVTFEMMDGYFRTYNQATNSSLSPDGPPQDAPAIEVLPAFTIPGQRPAWTSSESRLSGIEMQVNSEHKGWWAAKYGTFYDGFMRKERPNPSIPDQTLPAPGWWEPPEPPEQQALSG